jgi:hypothetical protein
MARDETVFSKIISMLKEQKLKILSTNKAEPTLEDVYICLVGKGFEEEEADSSA